ncbi:MAG: hypothetical protein E7336_03480 [Clostridiales bacterium]|nr:hypothetical protein [Clostridiales bacterium]
MMDIPVITLMGLEITLYALLGAIGFLLAAGLMGAIAPKFHLTRKVSCLYSLLAGFLGLLLGRLIFCLVRMDTLFYDEMGEYLGLVPFFDPAAGSVSVAGVMLGVILAAPLCRLLTGKSAAAILDHAAFPALLFFAFMRFIEPLSGQGYGIPLEDSPFAIAPFASYNDWNEAWMLNIGFIEGALATLVMAGLLLLHKKIRKSGSLALYAALFLAVTQIIPEALRCDDALYIFIFARVTHIGLAVMLFFTALLSLWRGKKQGLPTGIFCLELVLTLLCLVLCILAIYALDKITAWPPAFVYSGWALVLVFLAILIGRRIHKEDIR